MTLDEFQTAIAPAIRRWPRDFNGDQVHLFHVEFKNYSGADFSRVVNHLLINNKGAPKEIDFKKAISELKIRPIVQVITRAASPEQSEEDFQYCIRENIWANNKYIFVRGDTVRNSSFIIKADFPNHPLVLEDAEVRGQRLAEIKDHIKKGTYLKFSEEQNGPMGLRPLRFNMGEV